MSHLSDKDFEDLKKTVRTTGFGIALDLRERQGWRKREMCYSPYPNLQERGDGDGLARICGCPHCMAERKETHERKRQNKQFYAFRKF